MKAIRISKYGGPDVIRIQEVEKPVPKDNEMLIKIQATVVAPPDSAFRKGKPFVSRLFTGLLRPGQTPGDVLAGVVEAVGKDVTRFKAGDEVYGSSGASFGADAEYIAVPEDSAIALKPAAVTCEEAAAISEGALTALPFLRDSGRIGKGQKVLINGASGGVGVYAVQLAKYFGAEVTAVCGAGNAELVKSLGADHAIDYAKEDFTRSGGRYDVVFDAVAKSAFSRCKRVLPPGGAYLSTVPSAGILLSMLFTSASKGKRAVFAATGLRKPEEKRKDLHFLSGLMEDGKLRAVVGRTFPLEQIADAHRYVDTGHKRGSAVIRIDHSEKS